MLKQIFVVVVLLVALVIEAGPARSADLSANIMRRVNAANQSLDKAEDLINRNRAELTENHLEGARQEYDNIFAYYGGSFDPNHPTLVSLKARIESLSAKAKGEAAKAPSVTESPAGTEAATAPPLATARAAGESKDLLPNIRRVIGIIDGTLNEVKKDIAAGNSADANFRSARAEYDKIFERYSGMFDPNHPDIIAVKARIDDAERSVGAAAKAEMASTPVESLGQIVGMPPPMARSLKDVGVHLSFLAGKLDNARKAEASAARRDPNEPKLSPLAENTPVVEREWETVERLLNAFNRDFAGSYDPQNEAYVQVKTRVAKARQDMAKLRADVGAEASGVQQQVSE